MSSVILPASPVVDDLVPGNTSPLINNVGPQSREHKTVKRLRSSFTECVKDMPQWFYLYPLCSSDIRVREREGRPWVLSHCLLSAVSYPEILLSRLSSIQAASYHDSNIANELCLVSWLPVTEDMAT